MVKPKTKKEEEKSETFYDVLVYKAHLIRGYGKQQVHHVRIEVIGECLIENDTANFVLQTVYEALKKSRRINARLEKEAI